MPRRLAVGYAAIVRGPRESDRRLGMNDKLESVLDQFRPGFDADGFDVSVQDVVGGVVALRIVHRSDACEECLIADDMLGPMLATAFRNVSPEITDVRIEHVGRPSA
jgi:Fe-S cluster biogenesis protein NfuA